MQGTSTRKCSELILTKEIWTNYFGEREYWLLTQENFKLRARKSLNMQIKTLNLWPSLRILFINLFLCTKLNKFLNALITSKQRVFTYLDNIVFTVHGHMPEQHLFDHQLEQRALFLCSIFTGMPCRFCSLIFEYSGWKCVKCWILIDVTEISFIWNEP